MAALLALLGALGACATAPRELDAWLPRAGGSAAALAGVPDAELEQLALVATDLVAALVQLPELPTASVTLQVSTPRSAFGNAVLRALEDAGYALQRVSADQGRHYVAYRRRFAETDAGPLTDYELVVGGVRLHREYVHAAEAVYPSSPLDIGGSVSDAADIALDETLFREQGGDGEAFVTGVRSGDGGDGTARIGELAVHAFERVAPERRSSRRTVLERARERRALALAERGGAPRPAEEGLERLRRTVLIFEHGTTRRMGAANKRAVRLLARDTRPGDLFVVTACTDADGRNEAARSRGARVVEEFLGHGLAPAAVRLAPCIRASYRHPSDDSPVPVEIVQYRPREEGASG